MTTSIVIEGSVTAFDRAVHEVGIHRCVEGFLPPFGAGTTRTGTIASVPDAEAALLAALSGADLLVRIIGPRDVIDRLVDDLRRLGPVDHRIGEPAPAVALVDPAARAILGLLAEGHTLGEAAAIMGLSRRTADRRLAEGRRALGAGRTTEAIARARRLGWLGREDRTDP